jgi:ubiquinone/menaquinone biosynthesis C-methylase UbiE
MVRDVYERRAGRYDALMTVYRYAPAVRDLVGEAATDVPAGGKVLDVGCGTGFAMEAVAARRPDVALTGLDLTQGMLHVCRGKLPAAKLLVGDFNRPGGYRAFPNGGPATLESDYDLVISTGALSEYGDLQHALPLLHRHLKPGGVLLTIGISRNPVNHISGRLWDFEPRGSREFMGACEDAGFEDVARERISWKWFPTNVLKYAVTARRPLNGRRNGSGPAARA